MNLIKATIAAAAVTVCCFRNDYPARADYVIYQGYDYGFLYGTNACMNYHFGFISFMLPRSCVQLTSKMRSNDLIRSQIVKNFEKPSSASAKSCLPHVKACLAAATNADNWY